MSKQEKCTFVSDGTPNWETRFGSKHPGSKHPGSTYPYTFSGYSVPLENKFFDEYLQSKNITPQEPIASGFAYANSYSPIGGVSEQDVMERYNFKRVCDPHMPRRQNVTSFALDSMRDELCGGQFLEEFEDDVGMTGSISSTSNPECLDLSERDCLSSSKCLWQIKREDNNYVGTCLSSGITGIENDDDIIANAVRQMRKKYIRRTRRYIQPPPSQSDIPQSDDLGMLKVSSPFSWIFQQPGQQLLQETTMRQHPFFSLNGNLDPIWVVMVGLILIWFVINN